MIELIKLICKQIYLPRSSESKTRKSKTRRGGSAQSSHWVRDTCDKSAHSIAGQDVPMMDYQEFKKKLAELSGETRITK